MKIREFQHILREKQCGFALFYNSDSRVNPNLQYFSGYKGIGALIIPSNSSPLLVVPQMELERAKKTGIKAASMEKKKFFESLNTIIKKHKISQKNAAIDKNNFTLNSYKFFKRQFKNIHVKDVSADCANLRKIKAEKEISYIKEACSQADKILQKAISNFRSFNTETEASAFLEYEAKKLGLELSFNPIVASGMNSSMPHHEPKGKINNGFCVLDFGVRLSGYCSDITRTIYVGNPSKKEIGIYDFLLEIQKSTIAQIGNHKKCSELYDFVNSKLGRLSKHFTHGLGHGVGVEIHELPNLGLNSKDIIMDNMAFTIEPGIYFPGKFGIRIEDTILFKSSVNILTNISKDLLIV